MSCFILAACATTMVAEPETQGQTSEKIESLPPQSLDPGQCGLFIWSAGDNRHFIGFETESQAKLLLANQERIVTRIVPGPLESSERIYETEDGFSVKLSIRKDTDISEGQRFTGRFSSKTDEGWDRVIPVVAVLSCLPDVL